MAETDALQRPRDRGHQASGSPTASGHREAWRPAPSRRARRASGRRLGSVPPGSLAASVLAAGLEDVDLGIQRLPPRPQPAGRGRALGLIAAGCLLVAAAGVWWQGLPFAAERTAGAPPAPAGATSSVDLETRRIAAAGAASSPSEGAPAPGGVDFSIRPVESNYTVVQGDTLERIAQRFGTTVDALVGINNLRDRHSLRVGQKLIIP